MSGGETHAGLRAEGAAAERADVVAFLRAVIADARALETRGALPADEVGPLCLRLGTITEQIEQGLHAGCGVRPARGETA